MATNRRELAAYLVKTAGQLTIDSVKLFQAIDRGGQESDQLDEVASATSVLEVLVGRLQAGSNEHARGEAGAGQGQ